MYRLAEQGSQWWVTGRSCFPLRGRASFALSVKGVIDDEFRNSESRGH